MIVTLKQYSSRIFNAITIVVVTPLIIWAGMGLGAGVLSAGPETAMQRWQCIGKIDDMGRWQMYRENLGLALKLDPLNVSLMRSIAKMHEWKTFGAAPWDERIQGERTSSLEWYRRVVDARPSWAIGWAELANMKIRSLEIDDEAFNALNKSIVVGKWQRDSQSKAIWLAVGIWDSVPVRTRILVKRSLTRLLHREITIEMAALMAARYNWLDELQALVSKPEDIALIEQYRENESLVRYKWEQLAKRKPEYCAHIV